MEVLKITEYNSVDYEKFLTPDVADNIGRDYFDGLIVVEGYTPIAGMVWEHFEATEKTVDENRIIWFKSGNEKAATLLFEKYDDSIAFTPVKKTSFALPAKEGKEEKAFL